MADCIIVRPVHVLPGKEEEAMRWSREAEKVRQEWGMIRQWTVRNVIDPSESLLIQVWESRAAYERWRKSEPRQRLVDERMRFIAHDASRVYEEI